jgi:hypothetical protein
MPQPGGYASSAKRCRRRQDHAAGGKTMAQAARPWRMGKTMPQNEAQLAG